MTRFFRPLPTKNKQKDARSSSDKTGYKEDRLRQNEQPKIGRDHPSCLEKKKNRKKDKVPGRGTDHLRILWKGYSPAHTPFSMLQVPSECYLPLVG